MLRRWVFVAVVLCGVAAGCDTTSFAVDTTQPITRILFVGNSLTLHPPRADVDWSGNWGMAASAAPKDYAHRLAAKFPAASHAEMNIPGFETNYRAFDPSVLTPALVNRPDLIIVELGDNVTDASGFSDAYGGLLDALSIAGAPRILCVSTWWNAMPAINAAIRGTCMRPHARYVDISGLQLAPENHASSERAFTNAEVGAHPGDRGMDAIANALYVAATMP